MSLPSEPAKRIVCAGCGQPWFASQDRCSACGSQETRTTTRTSAVPPIRPITYDEGTPGAPGVTITRIRLSWSDAFDIFGKFAGVFIFWQLVTAGIIYGLIRLAS